MTPDSEGLHEIANTTNRDLEADIVFVHGLGGASHATWRHGQEGNAGHFFWPEELGKDLPHCGIWTVGYPAGFTALGKPGMIIEKRAGNLSQKLTNAGLGVRPLLFITHSMGGLVVKSLIVGSQTLADADRKRLVSMIRGIVFCATPHRGSAFADAAGVLGQFLGGSQDHVNEMRVNAEPLDILHDQFIEWHRNHTVPIESYAENIGLFRTRQWWRPLPLGLVVPRASANPGIAGHTVRDVDDDHLTLVKPRDRRNDVYAGVLRFVGEALRAISSEGVSATPTDRQPLVSATQSAVKTITALAPSTTLPATPSLQTLKVLIVSATPKDCDALCVDVEIREIRQAVKAARFRDNLQIVVETAVLADEFANCLRDHAPQILHFSGYHSDSGGIMLMDENDHSKPILREALLHVLRGQTGLRVVVLNTCFSLAGAEALAREIDFVIGIEALLDDKASIQFAKCFYGALANGHSVQSAFDQAITPMIGNWPKENIPQLRSNKRINALEVVLIEHSLLRADSSPVSTDPGASASNALKTWQKKLAFLQAEEAKASDAEQKFSIQQRIEEAQAKIQELGG